MSMPKELKEGSRFFNQAMVDREHDQRVNMERTQAGRGHSCPMPLGIRMVFGELFPRSGPGAFEFGDIFLEGSNGARFGGAPFAAFGQTGLGDPAQ